MAGNHCYNRRYNVALNNSSSYNNIFKCSTKSLNYKNFFSEDYFENYLLKMYSLIYVNKFDKKKLLLVKQYQKLQ